MQFKTLLITAAFALSIPTFAQAEVLKFTVAYGTFNPGVVETFEVDTSVLGTLSAASVTNYGTAQDADFAIHNDSLGNTLLLVGNSNDSNYFAIGTSDDEAFYAIYNTPSTFTQFTSQQFFDGSSLFLQAYAGETAIGLDGTTISVSAVPEPSTWAMLIAGFGMIGGVLRFGRRQETSIAA